jgi:imidazole glycerol-phosphate synthase subunit HisF
MKKNRLIPVLLLRNGWLVQSKGFKKYQNLGNPVFSVRRLSEWASDELIYLDISRDDRYDMRREDIGHPNRQTFMEIIADVASQTFMPITVGGRIRTLRDIEERLARGADKIAINTIAAQNTSFIQQSARQFGSQCIVISMDVKLVDGHYIVMTDGGTRNTGLNPMEWARRVEQEGAGEILLNSIDRDGMKSGYDIELLSQVADAVHVPVIACGGVGEWEHFGEALAKTRVDAVAAANIFHYVDQSVYLAKKYLFENGFNVRPAEFMTIAS